MSFQDALTALLNRPPQRKLEDLRHLASFLGDQPFFAGVDVAPLLEICSHLTLHHAAPGEEVLHAGELTDRVYLLLNGGCTVVWHSRREGFQPPPPQLLKPGQALCEASLVLSGRKSDVEATAATAAEAAAAGAAAGAAPGSSRDGGSSSGGGGGAVFAVLTRAAWSSMCVRAPMQPVCDQARTALLCCCVRSLAASDPAHRTLEQAEDLAALLRLLPCMSLTPDPVLRAMSEAAYLRQLPPGTVMFEEATRAEAQFLVLAGSVQVRCRRRRLGGYGGNRGLGRSHTSPRRNRLRGASGAAGSGPVDGGKSVREMIEEERKAREALQKSLTLTRDGLREPRVVPQPPPTQSSHADTSRKWMSEFVDRARKINLGAGDGAAETSALPKPSAAGGDGAAAGGGTAGGAAALSGNLSRAANAWRRAVLELRGDSDAADDGAAAAAGAEEEAVEDAGESLLREYERMKREEAGDVTDVGKLLGGAGSRQAYYRALQVAKGGGYGYDGDDYELQGDTDSSKADAAPEAAEAAEADPRDAAPAPGADPRVRLTYLDGQYQVASQTLRLDEAVRRLALLVEARISSDGGSPADGGAEPSILYGTDAAAGAAAADTGAVIDARDEHLTQLYGTNVGSVEAGHVAGELPDAALCRAAGIGGTGPAAATQAAPRPRRTDTAVAGPCGSDVLVVALETLRRGHDAARDDLVSERLAMLTALEPLRGLSDEHQAQLALGCTVVTLDSNHIVVRQGQPVDALYVVLEGEVRLLDDSLDSLAAAAAAPAPPPPGISASMLPSRSMSLNGATFSRKQQGPMDLGPGQGGHGAVRARRGVASLPALSLLGPGGSFGESVLGYPEDRAAATTTGTGSLEETDVAAPDAASSSDDEGGDCDGSQLHSATAGGVDAGGSGTGFALGYSATFDARRPMFASGSGDGASGGSRSRQETRTGDGSIVAARPPPPTFLVSAVTSRSTKLLVLPRSLLSKYGYLRTSLPPFADLRREAINGRRQQLKATLQTLPAIGMGLGSGPEGSQAALVSAASAHFGLLGHSASQAPLAGAGGGAGAAAGTGAAAGPGAGRGGALSRSPSMPAPRPPPPRTIEFLEQMGFKTVSNPRTAAILGALNAASTASANASSGSGNSTPERRRGGGSVVPTSVTAIAAAAAAAAAAGAYSDSLSPVAGSVSPTTLAAAGAPVGGVNGGGGLGASGASGGGGGVGGSGAGVGPHLVHSVSTAERARRVMLLGGPDWPSRPLAAGRPHPLYRSAPPTQEVNDDSPGDQGSPPRHLPLPPPGLPAADGPPSDHASPTAAGGPFAAAAAAAAEAAESLPSPEGAAGHWGNSKAPPKPAILRTSLSGNRGFHYSKVAGPRISGSGLPSLGSSGSSNGLDAVLGAGSGGLAGGGGGSASMPRRSSLQPPSLLRIDSQGYDDGAADGAVSTAGRLPLPSPAPNSGGGVPTAISPGAAAANGGGASGSPSAGTPTRGSGPLPMLHPGRGDSPMTRVLFSDGAPGSGGPSPRVSSSGILAAGGAGGGTSAASAGPRLVPSLSMRASYNGGGASFHHQPLSGELLLHRGSAPGFTQPSPPRSAAPPPQTSSTAAPAQLTMGIWSGLGASPRARSRAGQSFGAMAAAATGNAVVAAGKPLPSHYELLMHSSEPLNGGAALGAVRTHGGGGGAAAAVSALPSRFAWNERPEQRTSWDGIVRQPAVHVQKGGGGGQGVAALAVAALAAGAAPQQHHYLM